MSRGKRFVAGFRKGSRPAGASVDGEALSRRGKSCPSRTGNHSMNVVDRTSAAGARYFDLRPKARQASTNTRN
jgi:hypothetical protein